MSRIARTFAALKRPALITFIMAGDPDSRTSLAIMKSLPGAGADIIELGMPFTDPAADGPVIQHAGLRALNAGQTMKRTLHIVQHFREENTTTPVVLMGYFNPVLQYGVQQFMSDAAKAGVDGLIIVDLPPEEADEILPAATAHNINIIRLLTPTTTGERLPKILSGASGFLYYVSITGVTGAASADLSKITPHIAQIKTHTKLPIAIGFGVKTPEDAAAMGAVADAVVVGSALINAEQAKKGEAATLTAKLAQALHS